MSRYQIANWTIVQVAWLMVRKVSNFSFSWQSTHVCVCVCVCVCLCVCARVHVRSHIDREIDRYNYPHKTAVKIKFFIFSFTLCQPYVRVKRNFHLKYKFYSKTGFDAISVEIWLSWATGQSIFPAHQLFLSCLNYF